MFDLRQISWTILLCTAAASAGAEPVAQSLGQWRGAVVERSAGAPVSQGPITLRLNGGGDRFSVDLSAAGASLVAGEFHPTARPDVFGPRATKGVASLLGRSGTVNPLEGKPLVWGRRAGEELVIYRLEVQAGTYQLDRLVLTPTGTRLALAFERRVHDRPPERFRALLDRGDK